MYGALSRPILKRKENKRIPGLRVGIPQTSCGEVGGSLDEVKSPRQDKQPNYKKRSLDPDEKEGEGKLNPSAED